MPLTFVIVILGAFLLILGAVGLVVVRPRMLHWGASSKEVGSILAGDELISDPVMATTRAINIDVSPAKVWPWLAQMGQGRAGFYSYDWLENLARMNIHNSDQIVPELQYIKPGDLIPFWRGAGVNVMAAEPPRLLVLAGTINKPEGKPAGTSDAGGTWVFSLEKTESRGTRMVVRARVAKFPPEWLSAIFMVLLEPMHFIMERKMMLRIKELAEGESSV
jgi:hypothetical protein